MAELYSVYLVRCANGDLYTGIAIDVRRRLAEHQHGTRGARFLRGKGPLELVYEHPAGDRSRALQLEYRVKRLAREQKEALVSGTSTLDELVPGISGERGQASGVACG